MDRRAATAGVVLVSCLTACSPGARDEAIAVALEPCRIVGSDRVAQCGAVERPLDPSVQGGPTLAVRVAVFPARQGARRRPLYFFAGGPGQAGTEAFGPLLGKLDELGRDRDLVLFDQRGTGSSAPLDCKPDDEELSLADKLSGDAELEILAECLAGYEHDPRFFVTSIAAADLDAVREALGHEQIDLIGGSYGTRAAMVYARAFGDRVGRIVLDGVAPVDMALPSSFGVDAQAALDRMFVDCAAAPECAAAFPDAEAKLERWLAGLKDTPMRTVVEDPRTGTRERVELGARHIAQLIRGVLYVPTLVSVLPLTLSLAESGNVGPLVAQGLVLGDSIDESFSYGMFLSVVCAEDVPFIDEAATAPNDATFLGRGYLDIVRESCASWPTAPLEPGYRDPIALEHPTLVLSGELDPVTPPRWGEHVLPHLRAGRYIVVPGSGHGTMSVPCVTNMIETFLNGSDTLEIGCLGDTARPPFFVDRAGPPA
jgi:pimeloyl-ACP methyl ester carboxylesterase